MPGMSKTAEDLRSALVGAFYWRFSVHTGFELAFETFTLAAYEVESPDVEQFNHELLSKSPPAHRNANPDVITKSAVLATCLCVPVSLVEVAADASLTLGFENGVRISFPTSTPVVDWHWAITEGIGDPYSGRIVACFAPGEIQGSIANKSSKPTPPRGAA